MKTNLKSGIILLILILLGAVSSYSAEYNKLAQTGLKFLTVPMDARASAMAGAMTSMPGSSNSLFFNPAGMAELEYAGDFSLGQVKWIGDINYVFGSIAFRPMQGRFGVLGLSLVSVDYGEMYNTILADNEQGFLELGEFRPTAYALGLGYAKALTDRFWVGGQAKYVFQSLGSGITGFQSDQTQITRNFEVNVMAFDFGVLYRTGFKSLNFGMSVRNFAKEITYIQESFQLPLTFKMGVSMNVLDLYNISSERHRLYLSVDAVHPRDFTEQLNFGVEYTLLGALALRAGYTSPTDEQGINLGAGFYQSLSNFGLHIDYSYTDFGVFNEVHRFTFDFSF
ncbi:MAG: PorV/PorQ family protein [Calditrichia bacterium]